MAYLLEDGAVLLGPFPKYRLPWQNADEKIPNAAAELEYTLNRLRDGVSNELWRTIAAVTGRRMVKIRKCREVQQLALRLVGLARAATYSARLLLAEQPMNVETLVARSWTNNLVNQVLDDRVSNAQRGEMQDTEYLFELTIRLVQMLNQGSGAVEHHLAVIARNHERFPVMLGRWPKDIRRTLKRVEHLNVGDALPVRTMQEGRGSPFDDSKHINVLARSLLRYIGMVKNLRPQDRRVSAVCLTQLSEDLYARILKLPPLRKRLRGRATREERALLVSQARQWVRVCREMIRECCGKDLLQITELSHLGKGRRSHQGNLQGCYVAEDSNQTDGIAAALAEALVRNSPYE